MSAEACRPTDVCYDGTLTRNRRAGKEHVTTTTDNELFGDEPDIDYDTPALMPAEEAGALERASWHMKMASRLTAERNELTAIYAAEIDRLQIRLEHRRRILADRITWHELPIESLHAALLRDNPKRKTIELPYGTSKVRVPATPKAVITDKDAVLAWAEKAHPELLGHTINVTAIRTVAAPAGEVTVARAAAAIDTDTGEVIPGVEVTLDPPTWSSNYEEADR